MNFPNWPLGFWPIRPLPCSRAYALPWGAALKPEKSDVGPEATGLGLRAWFPSRETISRFELLFRMGKRGSLENARRDYIKCGVSTLQDLGKLIGWMSFSQTLLFMKFARMQMRPLYRGIGRWVYNSKIPIWNHWLSAVGGGGQLFCPYLPWYAGRETPLRPVDIRRCGHYPRKSARTAL